MFWYGHGMSGWGYALMGLGTLAFWALLVIVAIALFRHAGSGVAPYRPGEQPPERSTAEQVLAERFARGDIDADEYRRMLAVLRGRDPRPGGPP